MKKKSLIGYFDAGLYKPYRWIEFMGWRIDLLHNRYIAIPDIMQKKPKFGVKVRITIEELSSTLKGA